SGHAYRVGKCPLFCGIADLAHSVSARSRGSPTQPSPAFRSGLVAPISLILLMGLIATGGFFAGPLSAKLLSYQPDQDESGRKQASGDREATEVQLTAAT